MISSCRTGNKGHVMYKNKFITLLLQLQFIVFVQALLFCISSGYFHVKILFRLHEKEQKRKALYNLGNDLVLWQNSWHLLSWTNVHLNPLLFPVVLHDWRNQQYAKMHSAKHINWHWKLRTFPFLNAEENNLPAAIHSNWAGTLIRWLQNILEEKLLITH